MKWFKRLYLFYLFYKIESPASTPPSDINSLVPIDIISLCLCINLIRHYGPETILFPSLF
jgi:hypothetical protein